MRPRTNAIPRAMSGDFADNFQRRLKSNPDLAIILKGLKMLLQMMGQWDRFIAALEGLKDQTPDMIDDLIDMFIAWLQAL